ncbi:MAG: YhcH/YjgK/YiaL family protein [Planctomycetaceae bacterium]|nr:YhcH/YjgK/YiaL family protein [Planctomycetaceae bacterium]
MIFDSLRQASRYANLDASLRTALDYVQSSDFARMDDGRYNLEGDHLFAIVSRYQTKPLGHAVWESHRKYIDVQVMVQGTERMGYVPLDRAPEIKTPYDAGRDVIFYQPGEDTLRFSAGHFAIFFPEDIHAPGLAQDLATPEEVFKVVVKVACDSAALR